MEKKLFGQMSVGAKLMGFYILFGLIPLVIAYLYTFHVLRRILVEDGYRYIRQEAQRLEGQMNMWTDRYSIMIDSIYMDYSNFPHKKWVLHLATKIKLVAKN